ncbi:hypothetical protein QBC47DRAFT_361465 [Echria macrotheca]|uniref:Uncharacterized protein n=1 Tax=Echria macrotheca TaxID=438768 RepID=A0AAJ0B9W8_9PEZI|nr:hypothetical protein QBC47DRAFT_361465 [Echria macrotheca]
MTDEELDRDWKPNGRRPQSTIARSFSQELMDIFRIENSVADLDEQVEKRKQQLNSQTSELEALEARIREMEERLKTQPGLASMVAPGSGRPNNGGSPRTQQRPPIANAFDGPPPPLPEKDQHRPSSREQYSNKYGGRRPGIARESQQAVPGALPPTPVGSEGECDPPPVPARFSPRAPVAVPRSNAQAAARLRGSGKLSPNPSSAPGANDPSSSSTAQSMSDSLTFADYVVVSRSDGDGDKDV